MKTLVMTRVFSPPRQKREVLLNPDRIFAIFFIVSFVMRSIVNFFHSENFLFGCTKPEATFFVSTILTLLFIMISFIGKVDWYGKQKKDIIPAIRKWSRERSLTDFLFFPFLFVFDPFLFFIYFKNGFRKTLWKIFAWLLMFLSLLLSSYLWLYLGKAKEAMGTIPFILMTIVFLFYYRRLKRWAINYC